MRRSTRSLLLLLGVILVGCGLGYPAEVKPGGDWDARHDRDRHGGGGNDRSSPAPLSTQLWLNAHGRAQGTGTRDQHLAFSLFAEEDAQVGAKGTMLLMNSVERNVTFFGTITRGTLLRAAAGGGNADLRGVLTDGREFRLEVHDAHAGEADPVDRISFQVGSDTFSGKVLRGNARLMRARPVSAGQEPQRGFTFDPEMGLFILSEDLENEWLPSQNAPLTTLLIAPTRPDPQIDFQADRLGGYVSPPGSPDNMPPGPSPRPRGDDR